MTSGAEKELDVAVEVKELGGGEVELQVRVPPEPIVRAREEVLRAFGRRASIPGFRKGKAPRAILERHVDQAALKEEIADSIIDDAYQSAIAKAELKPLGRARLSDSQFADDWAMTFTATLTLRPEIDLGEYKGLEATRYVTPVTDEQVNAELERIRSRRAGYRELPEGAAIETGDLVVVSYEMSVEGEKRDDASVSGYPLEVGRDELFPELNEVLPGAKPGETREIEITYPEDHSDESLAGKAAKFEVVVSQARRRQLPELDDEFAKQVSDLETLEALRARIRENLEAIGRAMAEEDVHNQLVRQVSEGATLDVPQSLVDRETDRRIDDIEEELERRNLTLHQHLENTGRSFDDWRADIESDARQAARRALVLDEIGELEKIEIEDEELEEEIRRAAAREEVAEEEMRERLSDPSQLNRLATRLYHHKIIQFLVDNADIAEEIVEPEPQEEAEASDEPGAAPEPAGDTEATQG